MFGLVKILLEGVDAVLLEVLADDVFGLCGRPAWRVGRARVRCQWVRPHRAVLVHRRDRRQCRERRQRHERTRVDILVIEAFGDDLGVIDFGDTEARITGLDVDDNGYVVATVNVDERVDFDNNAFWIVRIDPEADGDMVVDSLAPADLGWEDFVPDSLTDVVRDVVVQGEFVYATMAVGFDADYDKLVRFNSDFDPDSVEGVSLEGTELGGPQRFVAQRGDGDQVIVTDWDGEAANARLVAFAGTGAIDWIAYADGNDPFEFYELLFEAALG